MTNDLKITFDDNLVTGNKTIDAQHKELIDRIQNFVTACQHEEFKKTIQELHEYLQDYEGPTDRFSELVQKNVIDWLFGHIKTYDRSVAKFIFMKENPDRC